MRKGTDPPNLTEKMIIQIQSRSYQVLKILVDFEHGEERHDFPPQHVFCKIFRLKCRTVTIFSPTQRAKLSGPPYILNIVVKLRENFLEAFEKRFQLKT